MTQVSIFRDNDPIKFVRNINEFIKDKVVIDIKYEPILGPKGVYDTALVIYKTKGE